MLKRKNAVDSKEDEAPPSRRTSTPDGRPPYRSIFIERPAARPESYPHPIPLRPAC